MNWSKINQELTMIPGDFLISRILANFTERFITWDEVF